MNLTIFDLDHTLIPLDSEMEWMLFLGREGVLGDTPAHHARVEDFRQRYAQATLSDEEYIDFIYGALRGLRVSEAEVLREAFARKHVVPHIPASARELVTKHKAAGDLLVLITGSSAFMTAPIVENIGILHALGTNPRTDNGIFTGDISGVPSMGAGKITHLNNWLATRNQRLEDFAHTTFYSDSTYDLPLLERVKEPVAANPKPALKAIADERGWRVINLW